MKSSFQSAPQLSHILNSANHNGTPGALANHNGTPGALANNNGTPGALANHNGTPSALCKNSPEETPYLTLDDPFKRVCRQDSTTEDEYDGEEFDDDSSTLVTPPMSSPLIKRREVEEKRRTKIKDGDGSDHWATDGEEVTFVVPEVDRFKSSMNGKHETNFESCHNHASLEANGVTGSLRAEDSVILSAASEALCSGISSATLPSPGLHRSDSVKFCRTQNGNAQRSGHGSSTAGMAGSTPAAGANRPARRVPSLKLKRLHVLGGRGGGGAGGDKLLQCDNTLGGTSTGIVDAPTSALRGHVNPSITITLDSDSDSVYSDYLSPEINYKTHECKVQFLGDENSLYGTPKEELPSAGEIMASDVSPKTSSTTTYLREQIMNFFQPSDNKLAMKLFGNKNALIKEKMRHKRVGNWVIHPCSNFRFYWDLFMLVLLIANLIILPVAISFFNDDLSTHWIVFNCISDTVFFLDIVINFRTGIILNDFADEIILDPKLIARHYLKTWFCLDLLSSVPMDYIFLMWDSEANFNQMFHAGTNDKADTPAYWQGDLSKFLGLFTAYCC